MNHVIIHELLHTLQHLLKYRTGFLLRQGPATTLVKELTQVPVVTQRANDVNVRGLLNNVPSIDDMVAFEGQ